MNTFTLATSDTLVCGDCGNTTFNEVPVGAQAIPDFLSGDTVPENRNCWGYICGECGHVMCFTAKAEQN